MHQCLKTPQIFAMVCKEVYFGSTDLRCKHDTLAALAQTCQSFMEPAFDMLWRRLSSLTPLVRCFAQDVWQLKGCTISFNRIPQPSEWERFLFYARRVKLLRYTSLVHPRNPDYAPHAVWQVLNLTRPSSLAHLLPNLQTLFWKASDEVFPYIRLLLSPTLKKLEVSMRVRVSSIGSNLLRPSVLPTLKELCPALVNITITSVNTMERVQGVSDSILHLDTLCSLHIEGSISIDALNHIAQFPSLQSFHFTISRGMPPIDSVSGTGKFPALRRLELQGMELEWINDLLAAITVSVIETVNLIFPLHNPTGWQALLTNLSLSHATLRILKLKENGHAGTDNSINSDTLRTLLACSYITHVSIHPAHKLDLDDQLLQGFSEAWPHLRHLDLGYQDLWLKPYHITLKGLLPLVRGCPKLEHLELLLNATATNFSLATRPGMGTSSATLTTLKLGYSPVGDPAKVAAFLFDVFPNATTITGNDEGWTETLDLFNLFKTMRQWPAQ
ncbi:hypothetical protein D9615_006740 [Tricholomella constricta]|uniref:Uncharacterized protein n=1 Tax=Tricholomella constricta TaxID=117010 RepID=A0A8H5H6X2_9AGAR|nr:hypothetical protein D9615_006740 [Tricholomella constricta]